MRMMFKQRLLSLLDSYDIFDEQGNTLYEVKGRLSWGHRLEIYDASGMQAGRIDQVIFTWLPKFEIYEGNRYIGRICKEFSLFVPRYDIDFNGWHIEGNFMEWDYEIQNGQGEVIATVSKELFRLTDTYVIDVADPRDALHALMFVLAIDAEKCSRNN